MTKISILFSLFTICATSAFAGGPEYTDQDVRSWKPTKKTLVFLLEKYKKNVSYSINKGKEKEIDNNFRNLIQTSLDNFTYGLEIKGKYFKNSRKVNVRNQCSYHFPSVISMELIPGTTFNFHLGNSEKNTLK